jgi:hypothetical protein
MHVLCLQDGAEAVFEDGTAAMMAIFLFFLLLSLAFDKRNQSQFFFHGMEIEIYGLR